MSAAYIFVYSSVNWDFTLLNKYNGMGDIFVPKNLPYRTHANKGRGFYSKVILSALQIKAIHWILFTYQGPC